MAEVPGLGRSRDWDSPASPGHRWQRGSHSPLGSKRGTAQGERGHSKGCKRGTGISTTASDETRAWAEPKTRQRGEMSPGTAGSDCLPELWGKERGGLDNLELQELVNRTERPARPHRDIPSFQLAGQRLNGIHLPPMTVLQGDPVPGSHNCTSSSGKHPIKPKSFPAPPSPLAIYNFKPSNIRLT